MTFAKTCPGSRSLREPTPEYLKCPNCGTEVEVWTHEQSYPCHVCGTRVFREQRPSCIDWCPAAKECIGPELYAKLKPQAGDPSAEAGSPLDLLTREHESTLKWLGLLRTATLWLRAGGKASEAGLVPVLERGCSSLNRVVEFFETDLRRHFQREEQFLFPALEKRFGKQGNPTQVLLAEHAALWRYLDSLKSKLAASLEARAEPRLAAALEAAEIGTQIESLLRGHIDKENTTLLPLSRKLLREEELAAMAQAWQTLGVF